MNKLAKLRNRIMCKIMNLIFWLEDKGYKKKPEVFVWGGNTEDYKKAVKRATK